MLHRLCNKWPTSCPLDTIAIVDAEIWDWYGRGVPEYRAWHYWLGSLQLWFWINKSGVPRHKGQDFFLPPLLLALLDLGWRISFIPSIEARMTHVHDSLPLSTTCAGKCRLSQTLNFWDEMSNWQLVMGTKQGSIPRQCMIVHDLSGQPLFPRKQRPCTSLPNAPALLLKSSVCLPSLYTESLRKLSIAQPSTSPTGSFPWPSRWSPDSADFMRTLAS